MKKIELSVDHFEESFKVLLAKHNLKVKWILHTPNAYRAWFEIECEDEVLNEIMHHLKVQRRYADDIIKKIENA